MFKVTGDIHGNFDDLKRRVREAGMKNGDTLIILGDVGANFYFNINDGIFKKKANNLGITIFCVHGNHEARPSTIKSYVTKEWNGGIVYYEKEYPNLLFAVDGEIYNINGLKTLVCGGAYSVDKYYRAWRASLYVVNLFEMDTAINLEKLAANGNISANDKKKVDQKIDTIPAVYMQWWKDEQPSEQIKKKVENKLDENNWEVDVILTHTSPEKYEPTEMFLSGLNQDNVDKTTEKWLDDIENKTTYKKWYAGHYHTNKKATDKFTFLFQKVEDFNI